MSEELSPEKAILQTAGGVLLIVAGTALLGLLMPNQVSWASRVFVETFGSWGVLVGVYLSDFLTVPIPPDAYLAAARIGGMPYPVVVAAGSVGSILGGLTGYVVARRFADSAWFVARSGDGVARAERLFDRYGGYALACAAVTPLPYSLLSYASGSLGLPVQRYLLISLLRVPRVAAYLWALELGVIDLFGS